MLENMLMLFIVISFILFVLSVFMVDSEPFLAIPFIIAGIIFCGLCIFGFFQVDTVTMGVNVTSGDYEAMLFSIKDQYEPYVWVYMLFVFLHCILFVKAAVNVLRDSVKGERR